MVRNLLPGLSTDLRPWTRGNVIAGLTVTAYLVPQVMAYATIAGMPPVAGLWAALVSLPIYAVLGTSRLLSMGPESSLAVMTTAAVIPLVASDPASFEATVAALALCVGVVGLVAAVLRLGFISDLLSRPILIGYMTGIAFLMIDSQLERTLGISVDASSMPGHFWGVLTSLNEAQWGVVAVTASVLATVVVVARFAPRWPALLIGLLVGTLVAQLINGYDGQVPLLGEIPQGLPSPVMPQISSDTIGPLMLAAIGLTIVGFTDCTLTARSFRQMSDPELSVAAELRALSVVNLAAGFFRGFPVSSSGSRTAVARESGATSQGYSLAAAIFLGAILLVAAPLMAGIPLAALGALVIYAAIRLIDLVGLRQLWQFRRTEFWLAVVTAVGVLTVGVLYGVLVAVGLSVLVLLAQVARPHAAALGFVDGVAGMHDISDFNTAVEEPGLLVFRYDSPLFFANAEHFRSIVRSEIRNRMPGLRWFALQAEAIVEVDSTAVAALQGLASELDELHIRFVLVRAKRELVDALEPTGLLEHIGRDYIFPTLPTLVEQYERENDLR